MERKKTIKYNEDVPKAICGMSLDDARRFCTSRGYVLNLIGNKTSQHDTYLVTVITIDDKGIIKEAKYGK